MPAARTRVPAAAPKLLRRRPLLLRDIKRIPSRLRKSDFEYENGRRIGSNDRSFKNNLSEQANRGLQAIKFVYFRSNNYVRNNKIVLPELFAKAAKERQNSNFERSYEVH